MAMMGYGWGMGPWGWVFMGLFWLLIIGVIVWAVVGLLPGARTAGVSAGSSGGRKRHESAAEILDRRFASGEIDVDQYRRTRDELTATDPARR
jgi:putative membrane protein